MSEQRSRIGTARRVTPEEAREHYESGGTVACSDRGLEEFAVSEVTTTHSKQHGVTSWAELDHQVRTWDNPYPYTQYYIVEFGVDPPRVI